MRCPTPQISGLVLCDTLLLVFAGCDSPLLADLEGKSFGGNHSVSFTFPVLFFLFSKRWLTGIVFSHFSFFAIHFVVPVSFPSPLLVSVSHSFLVGVKEISPYHFSSVLSLSTCGFRIAISYTSPQIVEALVVM